jgi:hypothetical protein
MNKCFFYLYYLFLSTNFYSFACLNFDPLKLEEEVVFRSRNYTIQPDFLKLFSLRLKELDVTLLGPILMSDQDQLERVYIRALEDLEFIRLQKICYSRLEELRHEESEKSRGRSRCNQVGGHLNIKNGFP